MVNAVRYRIVGGVLGVWAWLTATYGLLLMAFADASWSSAFTLAGGAMLTAGLLGAGVWGLTIRRPWPSSPSIGFFALHALAATGFAIVWAGTLVLVSTLLSDQSVHRRVASLMGWEFIAGILLYASVSGFAYAQKGAARLREQQLAETRARLAALQARLSPHFLFNALNTVTGLIDENPAAAENALEEIAALLRYSMRDHTSMTVTLAEEWEFTERFLAIARLRFGDRLAVESRIEPDAMECKLPALTIQPLVENTVTHGLADAAAGMVTIGAARHGDVVIVTVADNGCGTNGAPARSGLGLGALEERLRVHCGSEASVRVSSDSAGFRVEVRIPCRATG